MAYNSIPEESLLAALRAGLPAALPHYLMQRRWFGGKARGIRAVEVSDIVPFGQPGQRWYLVLAQIWYDNGASDTYDIPLTRVSGAEPPAEIDPAAVLNLSNDGFPQGIAFADALTDQRFLECLLYAIAQGESFRGSSGEVRALSTRALTELWQPAQGMLTPSLMKVEQSNSSIVYGRRLMLKIFRRVEPGLNPDIEIGLFLTGQSSLRAVPPMAGHFEYVSKEGTRTSLGVLQGYVANQGDAWQFALKGLSDYYRRGTEDGGLDPNEIPRDRLITLADQVIPEAARRRIGSFLDSAALLGRRTAELHIALASARQDPAFVPQRLSKAELRDFLGSASELLSMNFGLLRRHRDEMPEQARREADRILGREEQARRRLQLLLGLQLSVVVTRIHGDYHLGQVLYTGDDFVIIDFEGEPARSLEERSKKRSPLQDVAGMLRSFHYAAYAPLLQQSAGTGQDEKLRRLALWASYWQKWVSASFLKSYLEVTRGSQFVPQSREDLALMLDAFLLNKAVYELGYELNNRPSWVRIPLEGIAQLLTESEPAPGVP